MIIVIATIELAAGRRDDFLNAFHQLVPTVQQEAGCLEYGPTVDVVTDISAQQSPRENVVTIVEKWESVSALKAHLTAPHMAEYRTAVQDLVVGMTLQILEPA